MKFACTALLRSTLAFTAAAATGSTLAAAPAPAAPTAAAGAVRIAVVNPAKVFNDMAETRALQARLSDETKKLDAEDKAWSARLVEMQKGRDDLKPDSPRWEEVNQTLMAESVKLDVWRKTEQAKTMFAQKRQMKGLFDKIQAAIAKVAQRDGIDLVIADSSDRLPDNIDRLDLAALKSLIVQKNVLYVAPTRQGLDITAAVQLQLDADFKAAPAAAGK